MRKVFVTDMDDVIVELADAWVRHLNFHYRTKVQVEDLTSWGMSEMFPTLTSEEIYSVLSKPEFWQGVKAKEGSPEVLQKLIDEDYEVYICTATSYNNLQVKVINCLLKYCPWVTKHHIICCHNKGLIKCNYLVDDYPPNFKGSDAITFLMDRPWNRNCDEQLYNFRVYSMQEVYNIIKVLEAINNE